MFDIQLIQVLTKNLWLWKSIKKYETGESSIGLTQPLSLKKNKIWINVATRMSIMNNYDYAIHKYFKNTTSYSIGVLIL